MPRLARSRSCAVYASLSAIALANIVGFVVTPATWSCSTRLARLPVASRTRLRSSSQIETPLLVSSASRSVIVIPPARDAGVVGLARRTGQGQELGPVLWVGAQRSGQGRGDGLRALCPHATQ